VAKSLKITLPNEPVQIKNMTIQNKSKQENCLRLIFFQRQLRKLIVINSLIVNRRVNCS